MKTIWRVFKKEMLNLLRNRRRLIIMGLFNLVLLPIMAFLPMSMLTVKTMKGMAQKLEVPVEGADYAPGLIAYMEKNESMTVVETEDVESLVRGKQAAAGMIIPPDFQKQIQGGDSAKVTIVLDKSKSINLEGSRIAGIVEEYSQSILEERLEESRISEEYLTPIEVEESNTATEAETAGSFLSLMIPGFIITFGLTSGLSVAIASIAGEKESQTLEPVLFTPASRASLVFGKLLAVLANVFFSALGFLVSMFFAGLAFILSAVFLLRDVELSSTSAAHSVVESEPMLSTFTTAALPDLTALGLFALSVFPIVLFGAALQIMISSIARNSEEGFTYSLPFSVLSLVPMLVAFFLDDFTPATGHYAIPIFGTILSMRDLLSNHIYPIPLSIMFLSSFGYALLAIGIAVWMFNREEVVFRT